MAKKQYDLIVFDWDGTLMDSTGAIVKCIQAAARDLGLPVPHESAAAHVIGLSLQEAMKKALPDDLLMANAAGAHGIAVQYGAHPVDQLHACNPVYSATSVAELHQWLAEHA